MIREVQCSISLKTVVIFIDAMHNEESNRKKPKKVEGRKKPKEVMFFFCHYYCRTVWALVGVEPPKNDHASSVG